MKKTKNQKNISLISKKKAAKSTIRRLVTAEKDLVTNIDINNEYFSYIKSLFERTNQIVKLDHNTVLQSITLTSVTND